MNPQSCAHILAFVVWCGVTAFGAGEAVGEQEPAPKRVERMADAASGEVLAEELLTRGVNAFAAGRFGEAETCFETFLDEYASNPETAVALPRLLPLMATSQLQQKKFGPALSSIVEFFATVEKPDPEVAEEMLFWQGVCQLQLATFEYAIESLKAFLEQFPDSAKRDEAVLLLGTTYSLAGNHAATVTFFDEYGGKLATVNRGRATVLRLHAMLQGGAHDAAYEVVLSEFSTLNEMLQVVSFHTLVLQLGAHYLETEEYHKAIGCLQRVWERDRLLKHQEERVVRLTNDLEAAKRLKSDAFTVLTLGQMLAKVERELDQFRTIANFDSALRLRLATAFLGMERWREAAIIMEDMLERMEPDALVEQASVNLVRCWHELERWPKAVAAADRFFELFPESESFGLILLMKGQALQSDMQYAEAVAVFESLAQREGDKFASRGHFMKGFTLLLQEGYPTAIATFEGFPSAFPEHSLAESVLYWNGMAYSFAKKHEESRDIMGDYLKAYADGRYAPDAEFRRAYSVQALADYAASIRELRAFLKKHSQHALCDEARILLGDALMATGEIEKGIVVFKAISPDSRRFFEEGWFKVGKAYKALEDTDELAAHMKEFVTTYPDSARLPEAVYWIGWVSNQRGDAEGARDVYWQAVGDYGAAPERRAVEDLFTGLLKLYSGAEERAEYLGKLEEMGEKAATDGQPALAMRLLWAQAQVVKRSDPERSGNLLCDAVKYVDPPTTSPRLMADFADALRAGGKQAAAEQVYRDMVKWNPRAVEKDRAFAGLGLIALENGREDEALALFERFEVETTGSMLVGTVLLAKAAMLQAGDTAAARAVLEELLADKAVARADKAQALLALGESHMNAGKPGLAVPYYQRIYVLYGKWKPLVAKAYLRSGEAFEELREADKAKATYEEMLGLEALANFSETEAARERLAKLQPEGDAG